MPNRDTAPGAIQPGQNADPKALGRRLAGLFVVLAIVLTLGAYVYLSRLQAEARDEVRWELSAIADLKLKQIADWREERLSDARFFARARFVAQDVRRLLDAPDSQPARLAVEHWLNLLKAGTRYYAAMVLDTRFTPRLVLPPEAPAPSPEIRATLQRALQSRTIVISDLRCEDPNALPHLDVAFPVFEGADLERGAPLAVVLLELDASQFLFPLIRAWPTPSHTAETLLVRRDGNDVLFLNDLRHHLHAALTFRLPLSLPDLPAAKVLRGDTNVLEGLDYRGVPVVAVGRFIPGTPWGMVSKVDREEVYAPLRRQTLTALFILAVLLLAGALLIALLWRQNSTRLLVQTNAALDQKIRERTVQLVEANANLQTFAHTAAHDLRSPLRHIKSFTSLVLEDCQKTIDPAGRSMLERVTSAADQMARLLDDLLEYSKISGTDLQLQPVLLQKAVADAVALLDGDIRAKHATVTVIEPLPQVIGHLATLTTLVNNLLANALKFTAEGTSPQIRIRAEPAPPSRSNAAASPTGGFVRLWVEDNGIGIAPEHLDKIFGPFQRLHPKDSYSGAGLGLAIVRKGAERMGGRVGVESAPGKGSRFWLDLQPAPP